jgi:hypothetical protein
MAGLPWTPILAMTPPAAISVWHNSIVAGMPTASMAVSTPAPSVSSIAASSALPSAELIVAVAPGRLAVSSRLSSRAITMICPGERNCAVSRVTGPIAPPRPGLPFAASVAPRGHAGK